MTQSIKRYQTFIGYKYNNFAMTKVASDSLGIDLFELISDVSDIDASRPCIFPIPAHFLWNCRPNEGDIGYIFKLLHEGAMDILRMPNMILLLDASGEGFPIDTLALRHMREQFAIFGLSQKRVIYLTSDMDCRSRYRTWCEANNELQAFTPTFFDVQSYFYAGRLRAHWNYYELLYAEQQSAVQWRRVRARKFVCLNLTPRPSRLGICLYLLSQDMLASGYVSFHGRELDNGPLDQAAWRDDAVVQRWLNELGVGELMRLLPTLDALSPLRVDDLTQRVEMAYGAPDTAIYRESYFSVITETNFEGSGSEFRFTEKTWKPIAHLHPFLLLGNARSLARLRQAGYKTFSPFIDESYDLIEDPQQRFLAAASEVSRLVGMDHGQLASLYTNLWPAILHNFTFFHLGARQRMLSEPIFDPSHLTDVVNLGSP